MSKRTWKDRMSQSPVPLEHLPREIAEKALRLTDDLMSGKTYLDFKGKRMLTLNQREVISIPVGRRFRLICRENGNRLDFLEIITHEQYNNRLTSGGWPA
jgi:hypothetical protein